MYISMVALNTNDSYLQHQAIWSLFPSSLERKRDHLFRVENQSDTGKVTVLLQSSTQPNSSQNAEVLQTKSFNPQLENEDFYKFKILVYPTKCISQGKRVIEIHDKDDQVAWLQRKLKGANVNVTSMDNILVKSRKCFSSRYVCFEGILQITNAEQIYQALVMGIGRQKHAGAGLLSLAKAS
ncbi:type I-E CRISPR-associated protein Cas6/Cse3/CasE [Shewanella psychromarinicola]|uniref:Type I-E CRISPR-associated protein Cas6/Cse3/CasE n=1 Tax=Shewanella psychromarinicola TaxID=2487742 RepID=A0A3N4F157_9GAMM|nr:type I-E CRISPR-associated protein Cas6/Cse3/CasE [Shewanella psychromarinicola]AZG36908.1 type I-E CRISPR-associated protein Cas6/Cse3/CasE [Shewanella psychromarinicola]MCL1082521.1 type I-E CRISPR-associated protein Cas6/Cse3/CasE [Shewanella psychromarinicola]RPA34764.1 type I-E CRISPR-associated protein Cas6/Cse3/CasE [Shewanella psychromarinicola]